MREGEKGGEGGVRERGGESEKVMCSNFAGHAFSTFNPSTEY